MVVGSTPIVHTNVIFNSIKDLGYNVKMSLVKTKLGRKVVEVLIDNIGLQDIEITDATNILNDLEVDSFGIIEVLIDLEETFCFTIHDEDIKKMKTVGDLIEYIDLKRLNRASY